MYDLDMVIDCRRRCLSVITPGQSQIYEWANFFACKVGYLCNPSHWYYLQLFARNCPLPSRNNFKSSLNPKVRNDCKLILWMIISIYELSCMSSKYHWYRSS